MAKVKTKQADGSVQEFLDGVGDLVRRKDCEALIQLMQKATKCEPKMWGAAMVGFGNRHYKYESGREGDIFQMGFSPRKAALTLYLGISREPQQKLLKRLGKHKTGKGCLYIKSLDDVDLRVLEQLVQEAAGRERG